MAFVTSDEQLFIHQSDLESIEVLHAQGIRQIRLWGDRIGVLDAENNLMLRDGNYDDQSTDCGISVLLW